VHSVDFDVCAWTVAAFYIGIVLRENAVWARLYLIAEQISTACNDGSLERPVGAMLIYLCVRWAW